MSTPPRLKHSYSDLEKSIISAIVYYDCLDYPLTATEIFRYGVFLNPEPAAGSRKPIASNTPFPDTLEALEKSEVLKKILEQKNGFYFLRGRGHLVEIRLWRKKLADEKWNKIKPTLRLCQAVPYVRAIFISGSLALGNVKKDSDIDILVVTQEGRIWTCRALLTILLSILGKYRQTNSTTDKVCTNHYVTEKSLRIPFPSLYNAQTYAHFFAADWISQEYLESFKKANAWINDYLSAFDPADRENGRATKFGKQNHLRLFIGCRKIMEAALNNRAGRRLEKFFKDFETGRIKKSDLYGKPGGRITINDEQLEFHPNSPEKILVEKFNKQMSELGFGNMATLEDSGLK